MRDDLDLEYMDVYDLVAQLDIDALFDDPDDDPPEDDVDLTE